MNPRLLSHACLPTPITLLIFAFDFVVSFPFDISMVQYLASGSCVDSNAAIGALACEIIGLIALSSRPSEGFLNLQPPSAFNLKISLHL
jgi:hypothetical protein